MVKHEKVQWDQVVKKKNKSFVKKFKNGMWYSIEDLCVKHGYEGKNKIQTGASL